MTDSQSVGAQRAKWHSYFEQIILGPDGEVEAAVDGAMEAIARREDQAGVIAAGRAAAAEYRRNGGRRTPPSSPASPPRQRPPSAASQAQRNTSATAAPQGTRAIGDARSGMVNGLQQRQEMSGRIYLQVWNFRIERRDADGTVRPPVAVEMRARSIRGQISNGDMVEIPTSNHPKSVRNLTTGVTVKARGKAHPFWRAFFVVIFLIIFLAIAAVIVTGVIAIATSP